MTIRMKLLDLTGKKILITGAAVGIGKETAILVNKLGAEVILIDIDENGLKEVIASLEGNGNQFYSYDLNNLDGIESEIDKILCAFGPLDGFVHCVGIRSRRPLSMMSPKLLSEIMCLNFGSFVELVRCVTKKNNFNKGLSIVGISSVSSLRGSAGVTAYASSKAAMDCAVRCLAKELASKKIRLNTVVPAQVNTPAYNDLIKLKGDAKDDILSRQYLGLGEPADVANIIAFLLCNGSGFITGSAIPADGGFLST